MSTTASPPTNPNTASMPKVAKLSRAEFLLLGIMVVAAFVLILNETSWA